MVRVASGWFIVNGATYGVFVLVVLIRIAMGSPVPGKSWVFWLSVLISTATAAGLVWTGMLVGQCRRLGGMLALGFLLLPIVLTLLMPPIDKAAVVFGVIGVAVLISIWEELR